MKTNKEIRDIFKEAFQDYERQPSPAVWEKISKTKIQFKADISQKWNNWLWLGGAAVVITVALLIYTNINHKYQTITHVLEPTEQPIVENIQAENPSLNKSNTFNKINKGEVKTELNQNKLTVQKPDAEPEKQKSTTFEEQKTSSNIESIQENTEANNTTQQPKKKTGVKKDELTGKKASLSNTGQPSDSLIGSEHPARPVVFSSNPTICLGQEVELSVKGGYTYKWNTGETTSSIKLLPEYTAFYTVTVTTYEGKIITHDFNVVVNDCSVIHVPKAFTPNGDGKNDIFKAYGNDIKDFNLKIYSRFGELIYESSNLEEGWNGNIRGEPAITGIYVFRIIYVDGLNKQQVKEGTFTLIR